MPYHFNFDLTKVSRSFFREVARAAHSKMIHKRFSEKTRYLLEKFKIMEITGLDISEALMLLEDFVDIQMKNMQNHERFLKAKNRALFLPHCSRKYMDKRCKAVFDPEVPSYRCSHCSPDCLIHQATLLGENRGYDVYVLPGGSCISHILQEKNYEAVVGVACGMELKLAERILNKLKMPGQAVPLIKNGCANTWFNVRTLERIL